MAGDRSRKSPHWWRVFHDKFVVEERYMNAASRKNLYRIALLLMVLGAGLFVLTLVDVLGRDGLTGLDEPARAWLLGQRSEPVTAVMIFVRLAIDRSSCELASQRTSPVWGL